MEPAEPEGQDQQLVFGTQHSTSRQYDFADGHSALTSDTVAALPTFSDGRQPEALLASQSYNLSNSADAPLSTEQTYPESGPQSPVSDSPQYTATTESTTSDHPSSSLPERPSLTFREGKVSVQMYCPAILPMNQARIASPTKAIIIIHSQPGATPAGFLRKTLQRHRPWSSFASIANICQNHNKQPARDLGSDHRSENLHRNLTAARRHSRE